MTIKLKDLNSIEQHLVDVTTTELHEIQGGAIGGAIGSGQALLRGQGADKADKAGSVGQKIGGGIGAGIGIVGGGLIGTTGGGIGTLAAIGAGGVAGGALGSSLSG